MLDHERRKDSVHEYEVRVFGLMNINANYVPSKCDL